VREPNGYEGFSAVSDRADHDSRRCGAEFESARRDPLMQHSRDGTQRGSCPRSQSGKQERGEAAGALLRLIHGTRSRPGRQSDARTHVGDPVRGRRNQSMRSCTPTRR
jgi:hypothetical protein